MTVHRESLASLARFIMVVLLVVVGLAASLPASADHLELFDESGTLVNAGRVSGGELVDMTGLLPGMYRVEVRTFSGKITASFPINGHARTP